MIWLFVTPRLQGLVRGVPHQGQGRREGVRRASPNLARVPAADTARSFAIIKFFVVLGLYQRRHLVTCQWHTNGGPLMEAINVGTTLHVNGGPLIESLRI